MELLPEGQKNNKSVTYQDQLKINEFSKLILKKDDIELELSKQLQEKEFLDDISLEIELIDEDEKLQYRIGQESLFVFMKQKDVIKHLENDLQELDNKIEKLTNEKSIIDEKISGLKSQLYIKFGNTINLER
ncbi:probable Prefoldin subunit 4 [Saccharomycodes ludwigii]|uniref:Prefoldin subunit 4 n=1 Tax=Saccharomycodes ludwigii TaxID=36035 RepID=A0A376B1M5_9ASCO|nr:probable Prefoldin subunit 4 [Saccharomycodes ludwigii]